MDATACVGAYYFFTIMIRFEDKKTRRAARARAAQRIERKTTQVLRVEVWGMQKKHHPSQEPRSTLSYIKTHPLPRSARISTSLQDAGVSEQESRCVQVNSHPASRSSLSSVVVSGLSQPNTHRLAPELAPELAPLSLFLWPRLRGEA